LQDAKRNQSKVPMAYVQKLNKRLGNRLVERPTRRKSQKSNEWLAGTHTEGQPHMTVTCAMTRDGELAPVEEVGSGCEPTRTGSMRRSSAVTNRPN
jgi:hypothetical protein